MDENGVFTASTPGTGTLTVSAGGKSLSIPVTVTRMALKTVEDFENGDGTFYDGIYLKTSRTETVGFVARGHAAGKLDYTLDEFTQYTAQAGAGSFSNLEAPYSALNLWVYGDGSGNQFSFLYTGDTKSDLELPVTRLDFTGWKQISVDLPTYFTLTGIRIYAPTETVLDENGELLTQYTDTSRSGTVYLDQLVASFSGTVDNDPPVVTATLNGETVSGQITDGVDGVLPAASVTVTYNGKAADYTYDTKTGAFTVTLPAAGESGEAARITVTAKDASGNIGRASVDVDSYNVGHRFTDIQNYWGATYVDFLYNAGITAGFSDGTFRPNQNITRAQFAVMLYRYLGLNQEAWRYEDVELPFADLKSIGDFAIPAIKALYSEGILNGTEKNGQLYFYPNSSLTRAQASAMIGRTQEKGYASADLTFTDRAQIPAYAAEYIQTMTAQGVISGYNDGTFKPNTSITRGQMAKILYNLM